MTAALVSAVIAATSGSTAYCLNGTMADGTWTRAGSIAHNGYALGTRLTIWPSPDGRRRFVVRDRIGWGTPLDFWTPSCASAIAWGRRTVHVRLGWARLGARWRTSKRRAARWLPSKRPAYVPRVLERRVGEAWHN